MLYATWDSSRLQSLDSFGSPGERLTLRDTDGLTVGTVVWFPGRLYRVFWPGGEHEDHPTRTSAVTAVERRAGI